MKKHNGFIKIFFVEKGYGFIKSEKIKKDIFFHVKNVISDGFILFKKNDMVTFDYDEENDNSIAFNVIKKK